MGRQAKPTDTVLTGRAWTCGDCTGALQILPEVYWKGGAQYGSMDPAALGQHAMKGVDPGFAAKALAGEYAFIVAGRNFGGGGKSIEHPIYAIKGAGIKAVLAESFSRYFFRNAINNGLPLLACDGVTSQVRPGDLLEVDMATGQIRNASTGALCQATPLPEDILEIIAAGGYTQYARQILSRSSEEGGPDSTSGESSQGVPS